MGQNLTQAWGRLRGWLRREKAILTLGALAVLAVGSHEFFLRRVYFPREHSKPGAVHSMAHQPIKAVPEGVRQWRTLYLEANREVDSHCLACALFLGEADFVPAGTRQLFVDAGLAHLLSSNGLKCWIVALAFGAIADLALHLLAGALPSRVALHFRKTAPPLACLAGTWLYWLWSDQSVAITRVAFMASTKFALDLGGLRVSFLRLLVVQYLGSLALSPWLWRSASFQLTYGCIFGLVTVSAGLSRFSPAPTLLRWLWQGFSANLGAVLGMAPVTLFFFGELNFMSVFTHGLAAPVVCFVIGPIGLAQMMLLATPLRELPPFPGLVHALARVAAGSAHLLEQALAGLLRVLPSLWL